MRLGRLQQGLSVYHGERQYQHIPGVHDSEGLPSSSTPTDSIDRSAAFAIGAYRRGTGAVIDSAIECGVSFSLSELSPGEIILHGVPGSLAFGACHEGR